VFWVFFAIITTYGAETHPIAHKYLTHGTVLELIWTVTPALILMFVAFPSFRLLYLMDYPIYGVNNNNNNILLYSFVMPVTKLTPIKIKIKTTMILTQKVIQHLSKKWMNHFKLNKNIQITQSFSLLGFILSQLNLNVDDTASHLTQISYGFFFIEFGCFNLFSKCSRFYDNIHLNSKR
jgi:heme/copper-type cytochrome/quinol oxidase subunit 2